MKTTSASAVCSLSYRDIRAYTMAALFVAGNIVLPQLCHLVPQGGLVWLPIYFFTLVAAYKYGLTAGLLTAIVSPIVNSSSYQVGTTRLGCCFHRFKGAPRGSLGRCPCRFCLPRDRNDGRMGHDRLAHCSPSGHPSGLAWHAGADIRRLRHYKVNQEIMAF